MYCRTSNRLLDDAARQYMLLGYQVGATQGKVLVSESFSPFSDRHSWDGISIILSGLVCVDFDKFQSLGPQHILPTTLKERSPRGLHFFYRLPPYFKGESKIGWKKNVDLLTKVRAKSSSYYGKDKDNDAKNGHVLCSPSKGYTRLYPKHILRKNELPIAPDWLLNALR